MNRVMTAHRGHILESEHEISDGMAEIELQKLQRQYRIMEGDRRAYSEESRLVINKQRMAIEKLKQEKQCLLDELYLFESNEGDSGKKDGTATKKAEELAEQADFYDKKIRTTLQELGQMDLKIAELDARIAKKRSEMGGVNASTKTSFSIQKQIRVLENRLDKSLVKFNKALAVNKQLRETIDNLRRERIVFDTIYRKFERELMDQKKTMAEIIEAANSAYEARDEAQAKIITIKEKAEKEYQTYTQEIKELDRLLEQDRKLKEFMATKANDRYDIAEEGTTRTTNYRGKGKFDASGKGSQDLMVESMEMYEAAFSRIREVTGISDLGELVSRFKEVENQNFSLFNYVTEANNEIEKTVEKIVELEERIAKFKEEGVIEDEQREAIRNELEYEKQYTDTVGILESIRTGVEKLVETINQAAKQQAAARNQNVTDPSTEEPQFFDFGTDLAATITAPVCSESSVNTPGKNVPQRSVAGKQASTFVTADTNILHYLSVIEQRANELLIANFVTALPKRISGSEEKDGTGAPTTGGSVVGLGLVSAQLSNIGGLLGQGPTAPVGNLSIVAPSPDEHDADEWLPEEDDRPLTRDELTQKTLRMLSKRDRIVTVASVPVAKSSKGKRRDRF